MAFGVPEGYASGAAESRAVGCVAARGEGYLGADKVPAWQHPARQRNRASGRADGTAASDGPEGQQLEDCSTALDGDALASGIVEGNREALVVPDAATDSFKSFLAAEPLSNLPACLPTWTTAAAPDGNAACPAPHIVFEMLDAKEMLARSPEVLAAPVQAHPYPAEI